MFLEAGVWNGEGQFFTRGASKSTEYRQTWSHGRANAICCGSATLCIWKKKKRNAFFWVHVCKLQIFCLELVYLRTSSPKCWDLIRPSPSMFASSDTDHTTMGLIASHWLFTLGVTVISNSASSILKEKKYSKFIIFLSTLSAFVWLWGKRLSSALLWQDFYAAAPPPVSEVWVHWLQMM